MGLQLTRGGKQLLLQLFCFWGIINLKLDNIQERQTNSS